MGLKYMGIPPGLINFFSLNFGLQVFVETGTYYGDTAIIASKFFEKVITIERSEKYYQIAKKNVENYPNINIMYGDSRIILKKVLNELNSPAIFWLDAHRCADAYGCDDECSLLEELFLIKSNSLDNIILIDDARYFIRPPLKPHNSCYWPSLIQITEIFKSRDVYMAIVDDVWVIIPQKYSNIFIEYLQNNPDDQCCDCKKNNFFSRIARFVNFGKIS